MAAISEEHVSFETAKLLKEKGFDEPCIWLYSKKGEKHYASDYHSPWPNSELAADEWSCCTQAVAMKWLREVHNIVVEPFIREDTKYVWYIYRIETKFNKKYLVFCWGSKNIKYERYEQAAEAAIKYSLENLI